MTTEKYDLEWWRTFHDAIKLLAKLDAFATFDTLTREMLVDADSPDLEALHTATQWFNADGTD